MTENHGHRAWQEMSKIVGDCQRARHALVERALCAWADGSAHAKVSAREGSVVVPARTGSCDVHYDVAISIPDRGVTVYVAEVSGENMEPVAFKIDSGASDDPALLMMDGESVVFHAHYGSLDFFSRGSVLRSKRIPEHLKNWPE